MAAETQELTASQKLFSAFIDGGPAGNWSRTRFLGVRLRKFSLWHRMLLRSVNSPFVINGTVSMRDLRIAAGILRCEYGNSRIRKPWLVPFLLYAKEVILALLKRNRAVDAPDAPNPVQRALQRQAALLLEHFGDYLAEPEYAVRRRGGESQEPHVPCGTFNEEFEHITELLVFGFNEERAWNMPVSAANYYRVVARRASGVEVDAVTDEEEEFCKNLPPEYHRSNW